LSDVWTTVVVPLLAGILPAIISYLGARYQANSALQVAKEQQATELQKLKEQQQAELEKLKEQQNAEIQRIKEQQNAEIQRIREQYLFEIQKIKFEMEKQSELYEKKAQTDVIKGMFDMWMSGDTSVFEKLATGLEKIEKISKQMESGTFKNINHPANKRK
jgi:hypothetical protein